LNSEVIQWIVNIIAKYPCIEVFTGLFSLHPGYDCVVYKPTESVFKQNLKRWCGGCVINWKEPTLDLWIKSDWIKSSSLRKQKYEEEGHLRNGFYISLSSWALLFQILPKLPPKLDVIKKPQKTFNFTGCTVLNGFKILLCRYTSSLKRNLSVFSSHSSQSRGIS